MGTGRWGGRAAPLGRDVGQSYQGEEIKAVRTSTPSRGSIGREVDGEGLPKFKPKEGGSLNKEALGEKRNSGNAKPLGDPKFTPKEFLPSKSGEGVSSGGPQGEPGRGGAHQFTSTGSPGIMASAKEAQDNMHEYSQGMDMFEHEKEAQEAHDAPVSEAQRGAMGAAASGKSNLGIPKSVGKEFIDKDPGGKLPATAKDYGPVPARRAPAPARRG